MNKVHTYKYMQFLYTVELKPYYYLLKVWHESRDDIKLEETHFLRPQAVDSAFRFVDKYYEDLGV